jgi:hypothetical protein
VGPAGQRREGKEGSLGLARCWAVRGGEREKGAGPRVAHAGMERGGPGWKGERGGEESWAGLASCWVGLPSFIPSPFLLLFFLIY